MPRYGLGMHGIPHSEVEAALLRIQEEFHWASRVESFVVVDTWQRSRSLALFYRVLGVPDDLNLVAKTDVRWSAQDAENLYLVMQDLCHLLDSARIEGTACIRPLGWSPSPPLVVMPYVNAEELRGVIRRGFEVHQMREQISRAGAMLAAFHGAHPVVEGKECSRARSDALNLAGRLPGGNRRALALLERVGHRTAYRYGDVTPSNMLLAPDGKLLMIDPPMAAIPSLIHRDIGNFLFELRKQLAGRGVTPGVQRNGFTDLRDAFLDGYVGATLPFGEADHSLIALFEFRRAAGTVRKRLRKRPGDAIWFAGQALDGGLRFLGYRPA